MSNSLSLKYIGEKNNDLFEDLIAILGDYISDEEISVGEKNIRNMRDLKRFIIRNKKVISDNLGENIFRNSWKKEESREDFIMSILHSTLINKEDYLKIAKIYKKEINDILDKKLKKFLSKAENISGEEMLDFINKQEKKEDKPPKINYIDPRKLFIVK